MNTFIKNLILLPALGANLVVVLTGTATAQTFTNLHDFGPAITNGIGPQAGLLLAGGALYGTTPIGGSSGNGTVFAVNTDGSGFTNLYNFSALSANTNSDGASPHAGLILSGNTLFGTAALGGSTGAGAVFRLNTDGTGFTNLYSFTATSDPLLMTNGDGAYPQAGLVLSGNILFGTTTGGGRSGNGTVFRLNTDGTAFTNLYAFTAASNSTNSDGGSPRAGLVLSGNTLYGTTFRNGISGRGTVFKVNTDGTGFMNLHSFLAVSGNNINSDGSYPYAGLVLSGNTLYGTAFSGGSYGNGTVFSVNTDGTAFTALYSFSLVDTNSYTNSDGAFPYAGLVLSGNTLYGTAKNGGAADDGTIFSLLVPPQLGISLYGTNIILTWPTNAAGYNLQYCTNLDAAPVWNAVHPGPDPVNGQNTVTNPISGAWKFFRLKQ